MRGIVAKEPVIVGAVARLVVGWAGAKGFELTAEQVIVVMTVIEAVLAPLVRRLVSPNVAVEARVAEAVRLSSAPPPPEPPPVPTVRSKP